jgi:hypothetical protein
VELGELIAAFDVHLDKDKAACPTADPNAGSWKARINEWGSMQDCSGTRLYKSMEGQGKPSFGFLGGPDAYIAKKSVAWALGNVDSSQFPIQAHHLIPKNHLPEHEVCTFLAKKYTKNKKYQLTSDTPYDTDHAHNGYCMPYATPLSDWKKASGDDDVKLAICFDVMDSTGRQLHQGSHKARPYVEDPADPDEESKVHPCGYLNVVDRYLLAVHDAALKHADLCRICKPSKSKADVEPREQTVEHVDQASGIIKLLVDANRTFVSEPAFIWWEDHAKKIKKPKWMK